jgi:hypothetical protein
MTFMSSSAAKNSKLTSSTVVEADRMERAVLMRNCSKVELSNLEWLGELLAGSSVMSVVEVDKLARAVLMRNHSKGYISTPVMSHFVYGDDANSK